MDIRPGGTMLSALHSVWLGEAQSRSDVARILDLSRPTASTVVRTLIDDGFLVETGCGRSSGGKPPIQLSVRPDAFSSIGIDIALEWIPHIISCYREIYACAVLPAVIYLVGCDVLPYTQVGNHISRRTRVVHCLFEVGIVVLEAP